MFTKEFCYNNVGITAFGTWVIYSFGHGTIDGDNGVYQRHYNGEVSLETRAHTSERYG